MKYILIYLAINAALELTAFRGRNQRQREKAQSLFRQRPVVYAVTVLTLNLPLMLLGLLLTEPQALYMLGIMPRTIRTYHDRAERERAVKALLAEGKTIPQIAATFGIKRQAADAFLRLRGWIKPKPDLGPTVIDMAKMSGQVEELFDHSTP